MISASEAKRIADLANANGYDETIEKIEKRIRKLSRVGKTDLEQIIVSWMPFDKKHEDYFKSLGYFVQREKHNVYISWQGDN